MTENPKIGTALPLEQEAIRAKCFHPTGTFVRFEKEDIEQSISDRFEKIVRIYPDHVAVKTKTLRVTYDELNRAANRLAHAILARRQQQQEPVAVFLRQGVSLIVATLAVLKAGKIFLRVQPSASRDRTIHILEDSQAPLILTDLEHRSLAQELTNDRRHLINLDDLDGKLSDANPGLPIPPDAYAYIVYTSGSTGQAKGSVKSHRSVLHGVMDFANSYHLCPDDRVAIGHSAVARHLFNTLLNGATQCPLNIEEKEGLLQLADWLIEEEITIFISVPTAFRQLVNTLSSGVSFPKMRVIRLGGEPLYKRDVELYKEHFSSECLLVNSYSSAETGPICLYFIDKETEITDSRVPVGYPVEGMEVLLLDDLDSQAGVNQSGEIVVKSRFLSSGYWQKGELTEEKFLFVPDQGEERIYRTGDVGRVLPDGCLECLGRKDSRVKIRGFRVDIVAVEATLADHPQVREAAVVARRSQTSDTRLIGYLVPSANPPPTANSLRGFMAARLPDYMVPSTFVILDQIPQTATGKIDRRALPDPGKSRPDLDTPYAAPRTPVEAELAQIWSEVLSVDPLGIYDNFFDLGGHSLAATRVVSQVIKKFQLEIPLRSLFESPTVAEMAGVITQSQANKLDEVDLNRILAELEALPDDEGK
jgi:amino acid adenylation domain-containing protein